MGFLVPAAQRTSGQVETSGPRGLHPRGPPPTWASTRSSSPRQLGRPTEPSAGQASVPLPLTQPGPGQDLWPRDLVTVLGPWPPSSPGGQGEARRGPEWLGSSAWAGGWQKPGLGHGRCPVAPRGPTPRLVLTAQPPGPARPQPRAHQSRRQNPRSPSPCRCLSTAQGDQQGRKTSWQRAGRGQEGELGGGGITACFLECYERGPLSRGARATVAWLQPSRAGHPRTSTRVVPGQGQPSPDVESRGTRVRQGVSGPRGDSRRPLRERLDRPGVPSLPLARRGRQGRGKGRAGGGRGPLDSQKHSCGHRSKGATRPSPTPDQVPGQHLMPSSS